MRTSGLPNFKKPWGKIHRTLPAGKYKVKVNNRYKSRQWEGNRSFLLTTLSLVGGSNYLLPSTFALIAFLSLIAIIFFCRRFKSLKSIPSSDFEWYSLTSSSHIHFSTPLLSSIKLYLVSLTLSFILFFSIYVLCHKIIDRIEPIFDYMNNSIEQNSNIFNAILLFLYFWDRRERWYVCYWGQKADAAFVFLKNAWEYDHYRDFLGERKVGFSWSK